MQKRGWPSEERRKFARLETSVDVSYTIIGKPGGIDVFSKNISAGGLCLVLDQVFPADTPLQLLIKVPDLKDPIHALGRVVWQRKIKDGAEEKYDTGVEFTGISDFDRFNLNRYVSEHIDHNNKP
ncbi:PilZ domain-containing protein [Candidatus Omnitrophota bacterium]